MRVEKYERIGPQILKLLSYRFSVNLTKTRSAFILAKYISKHIWSIYNIDIYLFTERLSIKIGLTLQESTI